MAAQQGACSAHAKRRSAHASPLSRGRSSGRTHPQPFARMCIRLCARKVVSQQCIGPKLPPALAPVACGTHQPAACQASIGFQLSNLCSQACCRQAHQALLTAPTHLAHLSGGGRGPAAWLLVGALATGSARSSLLNPHGARAGPPGQRNPAQQAAARRGREGVPARAGAWVARKGCRKVVRYKQVLGCIQRRPRAALLCRLHSCQPRGRHPARGGQPRHALLVGARPRAAAPPRRKPLHAALAVEPALRAVHPAKAQRLLYGCVVAHGRLASVLFPRHEPHTGAAGMVCSQPGPPAAPRLWVHPLPLRVRDLGHPAGGGRRECRCRSEYAPTQQCSSREARLPGGQVTAATTRLAIAGRRRQQERAAGAGE